MDYSKFVDAVLNNDTALLNELSPVITSVLIKFLIAQMGSSLEDAQDGAQNALLHGIQKIKQGELKHPDAIIYYLFTSAKNDYLNNQTKISESNYQEIPDTHFSKPEQLYNLLNAERQKILEWCIDSLKADFKAYISYWFDNPAEEAAAVADHFGISVSNAWTKKHRILKLLKDCCQRKLNN